MRRRFVTGLAAIAGAAPEDTVLTRGFSGRLARGMHQGGLAIGGGQRGKACAGKGDGHHLAQARIVIDHEDFHGPLPPPQGFR